MPKRVGGVEELGIRFLAGDRIHLEWFTCRDCGGSVTYKTWVGFRKEQESPAILRSPPRF